MARSNGRAMLVLSAVLGVMLMGSGVAKLAGESHQVASFTVWGLPRWFLVLVGTFEFFGGLLLAVPATTPIGSLILSTIVVGALWTHVSHGEWTHAVPGVIVLTLLLLVFFRNRGRAIRLLGGA
jgi:putative oxidoreductase